MKIQYLKTPAIRIFLLAILWCLPVISSAQVEKKFPQHYFRWPLGIKPEIVANMGEMRNNHWHMGLDIRTNQKENLPVYAAATGFISKIRVEKFGFGQCIFITHPNGYTTVYAHLNKFFPALEKYVLQEQYKQESWAIELNFSKNNFPVSKGQLIAYSGNTGGSQGPHLHFEIRDSETETCLNPMLFGMPLPDNVRPSILKLSMYDRSKSVYEQTTQIFPLKKTDSGYILSKTTVIKTVSDKISFAIQAIDKLSGSKNEDGIFAAQLYFDGAPVIGFSFDSIDYGKTRYLNAHTDYKYHLNGGPFFQHLSQLPGERSGVYQQQNGDGVLVLTDGNVHAVRIEVMDANKNTSQLNFSIQYDNSLLKESMLLSRAQKFLPGHVNLIEKPDFEIYIPETGLYDTLTSFYNRINSATANAVSAIHQVNDPSVPIHGEMTVRIKPDKLIPAEWKEKVVIQRSYRNDNSIRKATWNGEWLTARFGEFGNFRAFIDSEPPTLNSLGSGDTIDLSPSGRIVLQPQDNFDVIKSFRAIIDGKWLRFTNDKGRLFIYNFDERCPNGVHELKVTIEDLAGNVTTKIWLFKKYPYKPPPKKKTVKKKSAAKKTSGIKKTTTTRKK